MRWEGQRIDGPDEAALPGLTRIPGLVRSVTTPEFAGVTFHEVLARTALNQVSPGSKVPFRWTINPYRGCTHACYYCLAGYTRILLADGNTRQLSELRVGDQVVGTEQRRGRRRRYTASEVLAHWETVQPAMRVELADGTALTASHDHRLLTTGGWRRVDELQVGEQLLGSARLRQWPRHARNLSLTGRLVAAEPAFKVAAVRDLEKTMQMVDITTTTGDFVAAGVVSHNCYARGSHSWLDLDTGTGFDTQIVVKVNVAEVLRREVARRSWSREQVALGTNTDPYQRAEGRYRLMPGIIGALAGSGTPLSILTKGTLLRRDLPQLADAAREVTVGMGVSVAIYDACLQQALEPGTPSVRARLDLVRAIRDAGLECAVVLAPVLPWLTDSVEHLDAALARVADAGASGVTAFPLHLRPGAREWFLGWLQRERPDLVSHYGRLYRGGSYVRREYSEWLTERIRSLIGRHGLHAGGDRIVRAVPGQPDRDLPGGAAHDSGATARASGHHQATLI